MTDQEWISSQWERCKPWIEAALAAHPVPTHRIEDVHDALVNGTAQIWPTANSAVVVEVWDYPSGVKVMNLWLAGGKLSELKVTAQSLERYARENGFAAMLFTGLRESWARVLPGFQRAAVQYVKDLR